MIFLAFFDINLPVMRIIILLEHYICVTRCMSDMDHFDYKCLSHMTSLLL